MSWTSETRGTPGAPRAWSRRSFLELGGGSAALGLWLRAAVVRAEGAATRPRRFVIVSRANGSIAEDWITDGKPGSILQPFSDAGVWSWGVALRGIDIVTANGGTGGNHETGIVALMTGQAHTPDGNSTAESLDQTLVKKSPFLSGMPVPSLQLGTDGGSPVPDPMTANLTLSYSGPGQALYPVLKPDAAYNRVFGSLVMPAGSDPTSLDRARARKQSVLDFVTWDLGRVRARFPASFKDDLDQHAGAIRELERALDVQGNAPPAAGCGRPTVDTTLMPGGNHANIERLGLQHLKLVVAAFQCDFTRTATFMWAPGRNEATFPFGGGGHHVITHSNPGNDKDSNPAQRSLLSAIDRWYSEKTAAFVRDLAATPDPGGGKLIENTLVFYINDLGDGPAHSFGNMPLAFFGGDGVGLTKRGRVVDASGQGKTPCDLWSAFAPVFGATLGPFAAKSSSPVAGLFAPT